MIHVFMFVCFVLFCLLFFFCFVLFLFLFFVLPNWTWVWNFAKNKDFDDVKKRCVTGHVKKMFFPSQWKKKSSRRKKKKRTATSPPHPPPPPHTHTPPSTHTHTRTQPPPTTKQISKQVLHVQDSMHQLSIRSIESPQNFATNNCQESIIERQERSNNSIIWFTSSNCIKMMFTLLETDFRKCVVRV